MVYDEELAERIRKALGKREFEEKKMFGGIAFMLNNKMCCGVIKKDLMVRVGSENYEKALGMPFARVMDFTGKPLKGMVYVGPGGYKMDKDLAKWVKMGVDYVISL